MIVRVQAPIELVMWVGGSERDRAMCDVVEFPNLADRGSLHVAELRGPAGRYSDHHPIRRGAMGLASLSIG